MTTAEKNTCLNDSKTSNEVLQIVAGATSFKNFRKENKLHRQLTLVDLDDLSNLVTVRTYWPREVVYSCVWVSLTDFHQIGRGKASGWGYCKESQAIAAALESAGFRFKNEIGGVGMSAVKEALEAIAKYLSVPRWHVFQANS